MVQQLLSAALVWVALASGVHAQADEDEAGLTAGLSQASDQIDAGDYAAAHDAVLALVREHADSDYVLLHVHRIKELLKRCAFRASHELPDAKQLIAGDLQSYDRRSGKIKVRYRPDDAPADDNDDDEEDAGLTSRELRELLALLGIRSTSGAEDFSFVGGVPMHPIVFAGPYTVEIKGRYPEREGNDLIHWLSDPRLVVSAGEEGWYTIRFGSPLPWPGYSTDASMTHVVGGKRTVLDSDQGTQLKSGKSYSIKINVGSNTITATVNGKSILKGKKQGSAYGQFGFRGCPAITELILNGQANKAWIEGLEDRWLQQAWAEFDDDYDPLRELPELLARRVGERVEHTAGFFEEYPGEAGKELDQHLEALLEMEQKGKLRTLLNYVEKLGDEQVGDGFRNYILAGCHARLGESRQAIALCDIVCESYADFVPAHILRARLLASTGQQDDARARLVALIEAGADDPRLHVELAAGLVGEGQYAEARQLMERAIAAGVAPAELEGVAFMLTRARSGPEWRQTHEFKSRNYLVQSNLDSKICAEASSALEASLAMYNRLFGRSEAAEGDPSRYQVYLFSGQASYLAYAGDLFGSQPVNTAGLYSPTLEQLLIWNLPDREMMMRTVRHEGFHQYLDRLVDEPPTWFNEGTAEYVETAHLARGKMTPGEPLMNHVYLLDNSKTEWAPLDELVSMSRGEFYANAALHYPQAWALVHYLLHESRAEKAMYDAYYQALLAGASAEEAQQRAFGEVDMGALQGKVRAHVHALAGDD